MKYDLNENMKKRLNPFTTGNPFLGTKLLGSSIGRGSGVLFGGESQIQLRFRIIK